MTVSGKLLEAITIGFENTECIYIPIESVHHLEINSIYKEEVLDNYYNGCKLLTFTSSDDIRVTLVKFSESGGFEDKTNLFTPYMTGYLRLLEANDITDIRCHFRSDLMSEEESTSEEETGSVSVSVAYEDVSGNYNGNQITKRIITEDVLNGIDITIRGGNE